MIDNSVRRIFVHTGVPSGNEKRDYWPLREAMEKRSLSLIANMRDVERLLGRPSERHEYVACQIPQASIFYDSGITFDFCSATGKLSLVRIGAAKSSKPPDRSTWINQPAIAENVVASNDYLDGIPYDKAKWHIEGEYPDDVTEENAYVFGGFFFGWVVDHRLVDDTFEGEAAVQITDFRDRRMSAGDLYRILGGSLAQDMLNPQANAFANDYVRKQKYWHDYCALFHQHPSPYHVEDSWENYGRICRAIDQAFKEWKHSRE